MRDTGPQLFLEGTLYYRQIDDLAMIICVARKITNAHWREFLEGTVRLSQQLGHYANVTVAGFVHAYPNPLQRKMTVEWVQKTKVPTVQRMGLVSDSSFVRGAIVALNWIIPKAKVRSFRTRDLMSCLSWLNEVGQFDLQSVSDAWNEGRSKVGLP